LIWSGFLQSCSSVVSVGQWCDLYRWTKTGLGSVLAIDHVTN